MLLVLGGERELVATVETLVVSGGVASNRFLMRVLKGMLAARGYGHLEILAPPAEFCTDNAAMIAWAGWEMYEAGYESELSVKAIRKWPVDATMEGGGILQAGGWIQRD
jgi:N6-L-threonylcarbamoyladenine synthase